ncbi:phosphoglycerate mutase [Lactarius tabidus]
MSNSVIVTFIRHAHSVHNNCTLIARPSPVDIDVGKLWLTPLPYRLSGQEARLLGKYFADTHFTAIHTSDLKRAFDTAQVLYGHQKDPKPSFDSSGLLRELKVGRAAGNPIDDDRFPGGESIKDLAVRARTALEELVLPHVWQAAKEGKTGIHVAVVSHGLCISELISELLNRDGKKGRSTGSEYSDIPNAGWTRVVIDIEGAQEGQIMDVDKELPVLTMRMTHRDRKDDYYCRHLSY